MSALLRTLGVLVALLCGLMAIAPAQAQTGAYCSPFSASSQDSWGPCANGPNITISTANTGSIGGASDFFLKLSDRSGVSAACSKDAKYTGNWLAKLGDCGQFCFDIRIFDIPLAPTTVIHPSFTIYGSGGMTATFVANLSATTDSGSSPGWHHICAPIKPTQPGEALPSDSNGAWKIGGSNAANPQWNQILANVTQVQLPIDYTPQPSEVAGYDNICLSPGGCGTPPPPPPGGGGGTTTTTDVGNCLKDLSAQVQCNPDGTYTLTISGAGFDGTEVSMASQTPEVTVVPQQQPWAPTMTWTLVGATPGADVALTATATKRGGGAAEGTDSCCSGEIKLTIPECPKPFDIKVEKTGGTTPAPNVGAYSFTLKVTNVGAPFTGANIVTVTDTVPSGMVFNSASGGTDWTCTPGTIPAGGTLTCTYIGAGPTAAGQLLGTISIGATATGAAPFPPFTNCATVGFTAESGQADANTLDNSSCTTVSKTTQTTTTTTTTTTTPPTTTPPTTTPPVMPPPVMPPPVMPPVVSPPLCPPGTVLQGRECVRPPHQACVAPMVPGPIAGSCVCPQGTVQRGGECVRPPQQEACVPPMVRGAQGACICPQGAVRRGGECVRPPQQEACVPPMVRGAQGACVCPQGTMQRGGECVRPPQQEACVPPMVRGAQGACVCPQGTLQRGGECVRPPQQEACAPPMVRGAQGACVCPQGTMQRGGECVRPPQQEACVPPMVRSAQGACVCPQGTTLQGRECLPSQRGGVMPQLPAGVPSIPGIFGSGGPREGAGGATQTPGAATPQAPGIR